MANILTKIGAALIILMNLYNPMVKADDLNFKQCFYLITENINSKNLNEELNALNDLKIPVVVIINPNDNININVISKLARLQKEIKLKILLVDYNGLERSYFAIKGYGKKLRLLGLCNLKDNKLLYIGEKNIYFDLIEINSDPLKTMSVIKKEKKYPVNYALVVTGGRFNISTLLLAYNELLGLPLEVSNYSFHLKKPAVIYIIFANIGNMTIVLFSISIAIFLVAIIIFKKWSKEKFLD